MQGFVLIKLILTIEKIEAQGLAVLFP